MAAGRPPKPTALKLVEGNKGKRAISSHEPDPAYLNDLTPPAWLPAPAAEVWAELAPKLRRAQVLTEMDVDALAFACASIAQCRHAVRQTGLDLVTAKLVKNEVGEVVETGHHMNPWAMVQSMTLKQVDRLMGKFGMSPADRSRIAINPQDDLFGGTAPASKNYFS